MKTKPKAKKPALAAPLGSRCAHREVCVTFNGTHGICLKCKKRVIRPIITEPEYGAWAVNPNHSI